MRRLRLSTLLIGANVGLLLLAVAVVAVVAVGMLRRLADDQALARVRQAGAIAHQETLRTGHELATTTQLLGERPTLRRLLETGDTAALTDFIAQFQQTGQLDGIAVIVDGQAVVQSGAALPWPALWAARDRSGSPSLVAGTHAGPLLLSAWDSVAGLPGHSVMVVQTLGDSFTDRVSSDIGLPVTILSQPAISQPDSAKQALRTQVLATGTSVAERLDEAGQYVAVVPLLALDGGGIGVLEVTLPTDSVAQSLQRLSQTLVLLALGVAVLAACVSLVLGHRLSRPLGMLTRAAARIGRGDLTTPIPRAPSAEIGTLAVTLEEMRRQLFKLTADLQRQQAEAQAILTGIVEGVFTVDRERRIRYLNPQAAALLGVDAGDAIGRFCGDVLHPQPIDGVRPCAEHCPIVHARFRGGARATEHLLLPDGRQRTVVITSAPFNDGQQVQVIRDETEIEATRRLRDTVLANISHEFRTPLSAQLASIELLLDELPHLTIEQIAQLVVAQQRGALRLTQLIDNLLESARLEAGQNRIRQRPVALDEVVEAALALTQPLIDQRRQQVQVELPYPLPDIVGDTSRLTQVFVNLLANANKFAPDGSIICIGGAVTETAVQVWVDDQGPGLSAFEGSVPFTRFIRAPSGEPEQSGVGLGLWIVKSIVERHGGRVDAQSTQQGTRMCITLPREYGHEDLSG